MRSKLHWLRMRKKTEIELPYETPIWFGNRSNGEYFRPATGRDKKLRQLILNKADENARRLGLDRREFLASAMGMATTLWGINYVAGCSDSDPPPTTGTPDSGTDARLCAMPEMMFDEAACGQVLSGNEFIMDVQTHWFKREDLDRFPFYQQLFSSLFDRATEPTYIREMFLNSDTTVAALTAWPGVSCTEGVETCGLPLSNDSMAQSRNRINQMSANTRRVVQHVQLLPQGVGGVEPELAIMEDICSRYGAAAWKLYPGFSPGFKIDDEKGIAIIEKGLALGVKQFCIHKGLQIGSFFLPDYNYPDDIGVVAARYPEANFVIYHSAICAGHQDCDAPGDPAPPEGPYEPMGPNGRRPSGLNSLIKSLADNGIGPEPGQKKNTNVYGEVGTAIREVMASPEQSAHFFGKLMKYLGPDYVVWGTDCVIYGSPQPFITWFRALEIPQSMQEQYGYPPLDATNKAKILGLNAARLYGIDPEETRCQVMQTASYKLKQRLDAELGPNRWAFQQPGIKSYREFFEGYQAALALGRPG